MSWLKDLISSGTKEVVSSVGNSIDALITSDEEKLKLKNELTKIVTDGVSKVLELQASIIKSEASGNWLQRSWRPLVMLSFASIVVYSKFIAPAFNLPNAALEGEFWGLLEIGLGGYVIGRSVEKVTDKVTQNIDLSLLRKKDRKNQ